MVNSLTPSQANSLGERLLQTGEDSQGNPSNFTNGPVDDQIIPNYGGGGAAIVPLANTVTIFEQFLRYDHVPLPP